MYPRRSLDEVHAELADEHRQIMALVARLESRGHTPELPALLKALHDRLVDHFAHEQFPGGLYECMGARAPQCHDQLQALVRDHCTLLSDARSLVDRARSGQREGLLSDVAALIAALRDHEEREHRLADSLRAGAGSGVAG